MLSQVYQMSTRMESSRPPRLDPENRSALAHAAPADGSRGAARLVPGRERAARHDDGRNALAIRARFRTCPHGAARASRRSIESSRRSVYLPVLRGALYDVFRTFDFPDPAVSNGDRADDDGRRPGLVHDEQPPIVEQASERLADVAA